MKAERRQGTGPEGRHHERHRPGKHAGSNVAVVADAVDDDSSCPDGDSDHRSPSNASIQRVPLTPRRHPQDRRPGHSPTTPERLRARSNRLAHDDLRRAKSADPRHLRVLRESGLVQVRVDLLMRWPSSTPPTTAGSSSTPPQGRGATLILPPAPIRSRSARSRENRQRLPRERVEAAATRAVAVSTRRQDGQTAG